MLLIGKIFWTSLILQGLGWFILMDEDFFDIDGVHTTAIIVVTANILIMCGCTIVGIWI